MGRKVHPMVSLVSTSPGKDAGTLRAQNIALNCTRILPSGT